MTILKKPVRREIPGREMSLIVTLELNGVTIREKGARRALGPLPYSYLYAVAAGRRAEQIIADRHARRRVRR